MLISLLEVYAGMNRPGTLPLGSPRRPLLLNSDHIIAIYKTDEAITVIDTINRSYHVLQTPDEISTLLAASTTST